MEKNIYRYVFTTRDGSKVTLLAENMENARKFLIDAKGNDIYEKVEIEENYSPNK